MKLHTAEAHTRTVQSFSFLQGAGHFPVLGLLFVILQRSKKSKKRKQWRKKWLQSRSQSSDFSLLQKLYKKPLDILRGIFNSARIILLKKKLKNQKHLLLIPTELKTHFNTLTPPPHATIRWAFQCIILKFHSSQFNCTVELNWDKNTHTRRG